MPVIHSAFLPSGLPLGRFFMRRLIALLFLALHLCATTQLHELLKLPALVSHYLEHEEAESDLTFLAFLTRHYASGNTEAAPTARHQKEHSQLPFKEGSSGHSSFWVAAPVPEVWFEMGHSAVYRLLSTTKWPRFCTSRAPSIQLSAIWQPPRLAA